MAKEVKSKAKQTGADVRTVVKNFTRLVEAVSLLFVAVVAVSMVHKYSNNTVLVYTTYFAGALIGVRGAFEFLKHLANK